jgi:spore germination cell wall hydrolase CwlJ-like protein
MWDFQRIAASNWRHVILNAVGASAARLRDYMPLTATHSRLSHPGLAKALAKGSDHSPKLLLAFGGASIALSALAMAHALADPVVTVTHDPQAFSALGLGSRSDRSGPHFTDTADEAVLILVKSYGALRAPQASLFGLSELAQQAPEIAPQAYRQLTPQQAVAINASIPFSALPNPAARAFRVDAADVADHAAALNCLTAAVYYEAASESDDGEAAVAQVVLNRMRHPLFPKTVCGVVFQGSQLPTGCQFTFTCDGSLARRPSADGWKRAQKVAERALGGYVMKQVGEATHYHTQWVVPYWQPTVTKLTQIGAHIFYRWSGGMGSPQAFHGQYAGFEAQPTALSALDQQDLAAAPLPGLTVASAVQTSQPVVALVRADQLTATAGRAPSASGAGAVEAVAMTPTLPPEVKAAMAAPPPRASFFGRAAAPASPSPW